MTPERWQRVKELFAAALEREPAERSVFLSKACGNDEALRVEVEVLLTSDKGADSFMETPAVAGVARSLVGNQKELAAGQRVGHYEIVQALGRGGMGEVYLARDSRLGRLAILKLLPSDFAKDEQRVRRFAQEPRAASALNHPNICVVYEVGKTSEGRDFIAMEHIAGVTLRERIAQGTLSPAEAASVAEQVATALGTAHAAGIIHRDIKPENIMLRDDGYVKVLDFGLAKVQRQLRKRRGETEVPNSSQVLTEPGMRMGTVQYMSPEQLRELPVDGRTDIWSLGVVLHELVTGRTPFAAQNTNDSIALILAPEPARLAFSGDAVPFEFQRIVERAVCKEREARYQTAEELATDLKQIRGRPGVEPVAQVLRLVGSATRTNGKRRDSAVGHNANASFVKSQLALSTSYLLGELKRRPKTAVFAGIAIVLAALWFVRAVEPVLFQAISITPLTNSGRAVCAAISPDGRFVAYAVNEDGRQTLLLVGLATGGTSVVIPASEGEYLGITFSQDGNYLYVTRRPQKNAAGILYQLALPGGLPRKIKDAVDSPISFSPEGDNFSFVRFDRAKGEYILMVAELNGATERTLATRGDGNRFSLYGSAWSTDGKRIVCAAGRWDKGYRMNLVEVDVAEGRERPLGEQQWFSVLQVGWLADRSSLIVSARERWTSPYQLWRVSYPTGEAVRITNDTFEHETVSLSRDGNTIVSLQNQQVGQLWVGPAGDGQRTRVIASKVGRIYGLNWTRGGKLVFSGMAGNNLNIFLLDPDGAHQNQLTVNDGDNYNPMASPDGRFIVFASNRTGSLNIWRMNADDGSEPRQLTFGDGNSHPSCSADSQWVAYDNQSAPITTLWKVGIDGGEPVRLTDNALMAVVSPDNQFIACRYQGEIAILAAQGGEPVKRLPISVMDWQQVQWSNDGQALTYLKTVAGASNLWSYDVAKGSTKQLTTFGADRIFAYAWSPDQTQLAVLRGSEVTDVIAIRNQP